jgi:hypothetical protein
MVKPREKKLRRMYQVTPDQDWLIKLAAERLGGSESYHVRKALDAYLDRLGLSDPDISHQRTSSEGFPR